MFSAGGNVKMLVTDWHEIYETDRSQGMADLVDLLLMVIHFKLGPQLYYFANLNAITNFLDCGC